MDAASRRLRPLIGILISGAFLVVPHLAFAAEVTSLAELVLGIYEYSLSIVGLCVFIMFLYAGYLLMFGNQSQAIKIMQDAAIGMILLFSAYVILNSINTDLVTPKDPTPPRSAP